MVWNTKIGLRLTNAVSEKRNGEPDGCLPNGTWKSGLQSVFSVDRKVLLYVYRSTGLNEVVHLRYRLQTSDFGD